MTITGWLQIALVLGAVLAAAWPLGLYMARVLSGERTFLSSILLPVQRAVYAAANVDPKKEQTWLSCALAMLAINGLGFLLLYVLMRFQHLLPLNPQGFAAIPPDLAFNTAVSFVTNTNWQPYGGETTMSHLVQMAGLTVQNFLSAATGIALALAVTRAFARSCVSTLGNFWADLTRATLYVLLPLSIIVALGFALSGMPRPFLAAQMLRRSKAQSRSSRSDLSQAKRRSSSSARMVAASSMSMLRIRSRTPMRGRTFSRSGRCS